VDFCGRLGVIGVVGAVSVIGVVSVLGAKKSENFWWLIISELAMAG
jgi:hypothetical protein